LSINAITWLLSRKLLNLKLKSHQQKKRRKDVAGRGKLKLCPNTMM